MSTIMGVFHSNGWPVAPEAHGYPPDRPETELLLCCARAHMTPERADRVRELLQQDMNWAYLLSMARRHRIMPLLFRQLTSVRSEAVPGAALEQLRDHFRVNSLRNLSLTRRLLELVNAFEANGILIIPFKGPVLTASLYKNLSFREFIDLDVLVRKRDVSRAGKLLMSLGYQPEYRMTHAEEVAFLRYEREFKYVSEDGGGIVELHWQIAPRGFPLSFDTEQLEKRLEWIPLADATVPNLSPEDLLLFLCVHGAAHRWERLGWLCDVAELVRVHEEVDWERVAKRASAQGSRRIVLLGLFLAHELLGAHLPETMVRGAREDATIRELARQVRERLFRESNGAQEVIEEEAHFQPFHLRAMERLPDRVRYCVSQATMPVFRDWELLPLPVPLFPLYRVLRPVRLAAKYGQRVSGWFLRPRQP